MRTKLTNARGLSLIEVTIMLLVLMLLTGVLAPSIMDFVKDAQWVKVKEDCEAIGVSVARLTRDIGPCLKFKGTGRCTQANRVDILFSDGPNVTTEDLSDDATADFRSAGNLESTLNWDMESSRGDSMENQFTTNVPNYLSPEFFGGYGAVGPQFNLGWRGAYLSAPIGPDPWGHRYLVNSVFLSVAIDAAPGTGEGQRSGGWSNDSFCISAGPNGSYQTAFGGNGSHGVTRRGDDFLFIISGDTR
jgi:type II secretory pathway pseudopilin PulG